MNNDFLVTREVICQWFSLVTSSLVKIIGKSPHSWLKIVIHGNSCIILYIWKDHLCIETDPATGSEILIYCCIRVMSHECSGIVLQLVQADNKEKINTLLAICEVNPPVASDSRKSFPGHHDVIMGCALPSKSTLLCCNFFGQPGSVSKFPPLLWVKLWVGWVGRGYTEISRYFPASWINWVTLVTKIKLLYSLRF